MRTQNKPSLLCQLIIALLILTGCASPTPALRQQINISPFPTIIATLNPTAVSSPLPIFPFNPTPVPTQLPDQELRMVALLQSKGCALPCYLGITPGKTSLSEAKLILENIGAYDIGNLVRKDGSTDYGYYLKAVDSSGINVTPEPNGSTTMIGSIIDLVTMGGTVQGLEVDAGTAKGSDYEIFATASMAKFRQYWSRYSAREIFLQMGAPDHIYVDIVDPQYLFYGRTLLIVYEKHHDAVIQLYGTSQENNICPENKARFINLNLRLYNPDSGLSIYSAGGVPPTDRSVWLPIEEVLGVNTSKFYNQVLLNPSVCFKPK